MNRQNGKYYRERDRGGGGGVKVYYGRIDNKRREG